MPYSGRIKSLEESLRLVEIQLSALHKAENNDPKKLNDLNEARNKYLSQLKVLRREQYEANQEVDFGDDR